MADFIQNSQVLRWDNTLAGTGIVFNRQNGLGKNVSISVDTNVIATVASLDAYQSINVKDQAGGYAGLDETGKLSTSQINFDTSTFYVDENGILKLKTDRISNPFTASGVDTSGIPTGLMLGTDEATIGDVEINDTIRFTTAISWNETNYEAQTVFMRVASTAGTLADFAVQGAPVTSLDQLEQGVVNKYLTAEQLEKLIRMNYSDIAYTGQLSSKGDDCNIYLTNGVWNVPNASAIANTPQKGQGGILICFQRGTSSSAARIQLYLQAAGTSKPVLPYIRVYNGTAGTWSTWERIIKSSDTATTATNGLMSSADKTKLDGLLTQAQTTQLIQSTNRGDGVRRSYCASLVLGAMQYTGSLGWSATACTIETPTISLDLQNTPTDFAMDINVEEIASGKEFVLSLANGIQGTHCAVSFRNTSSYRIGLKDGNGKTVYLNGGDTALARLVSLASENRFEWISSGTGSNSGGCGGTEYVSFTAGDVDENGNLTIVSAGEPVAICKTDLSNRLDFGITAQESAGAGLLRSTINISGIQLGSGSWYAICK